MGVRNCKLPTQTANKYVQFKKTLSRHPAAGIERAHFESQSSTGRTFLRNLGNLYKYLSKVAGILTLFFLIQVLYYLPIMSGVPNV